MGMSTPITIVTGRSGSGKSTVLHAFEDAGYYCVDNLPVALLPNFLNLPADNLDAFNGLVFGMDLRESGFVRRVGTVLDTLQANGFQFRILFLEANEKTLLQRYSQTRRRHPLAQDRSVHEAILAEPPLLATLRDRADQILDTSDLNVHELKATIRAMADAGAGRSPMDVHVTSFGFKYGLPIHADLVMDVRFLNNPYFVDALRPLTGKTEKIRAFVLHNEQTALFLRKYFDLLDILFPQYEHEGKAHLNIAIGCTGGRHRSVVIADQLHRHVAALGYRVTVTHRDIDKS